MQYPHNAKPTPYLEFKSLNHLYLFYFKVRKLHIDVLSTTTNHIVLPDYFTLQAYSVYATIIYRDIPIF